MKRNIHVTHDAQRAWNVKQAGIEHPLYQCTTKQQAIDIARTISRAQGGELFIHGKNGRIQSRDSHGNDPFPPRG